MLEDAPPEDRNQVEVPESEEDVEEHDPLGEILVLEATETSEYDWLGTVTAEPQQTVWEAIQEDIDAYYESQEDEDAASWGAVATGGLL